MSWRPRAGWALLVSCALWAGVCPGVVQAQPAGPVASAAQPGFAGPAAPSAASVASAPRRGPLVPPPVQAADLQPLAEPAPLVFGRLRAADLGLVINTRDPYSVAVGAHYAARRGLSDSQILRVDLPVQAQLSPAQLEQLRQAIDERLGFRAQALALAWVAPYAVLCNSLVGALASGLDEALCENSCKASRPSPYANSRSTRPYSELRWRPAMHLAAADIDAAKALIDRGVKADGSLDPTRVAAAAVVDGEGGAAAAAGRPAHRAPAAVFVRTGDGPRNVRSRLYPNPQVKRWRGLSIQQVQGLAQVPDQPRILLQVGSATLQGLPDGGWLPGALADHLTSFGGDLLGAHGQATALRWIAAGATASHGAVSEPCNHLQKFPHPQWLMAHYAQGATAIEAYWKSVLWPQQSVFVGEPLAAPFAPATVAR